MYINWKFYEAIQLLYQRHICCVCTIHSFFGHILCSLKLKSWSIKKVSQRSKRRYKQVKMQTLMGANNTAFYTTFFILSFSSCRKYQDLCTHAPILPSGKCKWRDILTIRRIFSFWGHWPLDYSFPKGLKLTLTNTTSKGLRVGIKNPFAIALQFYISLQWSIKNKWFYDFWRCRCLIITHNPVQHVTYTCRKKTFFELMIWSHFEFYSFSFGLSKKSLGTGSIEASIREFVVNGQYAESKSPLIGQSTELSTTQWQVKM